MKHYTDTISKDLAEKLKEKGMPVEIVCDNTVEHSYPPEYHCETMFCEIFDWLETKGIGIGIKHHWSGIVYQGYDWQVCQFDKSITPYFDTAYGTWHEVAEAAIEKALTLI